MTKEKFYKCFLTDAPGGWHRFELDNTMLVNNQRKVVIHPIGMDDEYNHVHLVYCEKGSWFTQDDCFDIDDDIPAALLVELAKLTAKADDL